MMDVKLEPRQFPNLIRNILEPEGCGIANVKWCVHQIGPDDLQPMPDYKTAVLYAAVNNAVTARHFADESVLCVSAPAVWMSSDESHAAGVARLQSDFDRMDELLEYALSDRPVEKSPPQRRE